MYTHGEMQYNFIYFLIILFVCRKLPNWEKRVYDTYSYNKVSRCSWDWIEYATNMEICL